MAQGQGEEVCSSPERAGKYLKALLNISVNMQRMEKLIWIPLAKNNTEPGCDISLEQMLKRPSGYSVLWETAFPLLVFPERTNSKTKLKAGDLV